MKSEFEKRIEIKMTPEKPAYKLEKEYKYKYH